MLESGGGGGIESVEELAVLGGGEVALGEVDVGPKAGFGRHPSAVGEESAPTLFFLVAKR